jgi:hypothetical protein
LTYLSVGTAAIATVLRKAKAMSAKRDYHNWTGDRRYVRRGNDGRFRESDDIGSSLAVDRHQHAKTEAGQDDGGDGKRG